jgi:hypothetical protein
MITKYLIKPKKFVTDEMHRDLLKDGTACHLKQKYKQKLKNSNDAEVAKEQAKQSAINKLKALGLTDAEVEAFRN